MPFKFSSFLLLLWLLASPSLAAPKLELKILGQPQKEGELKLVYANAELRFFDSVNGKALQKLYGIAQKKPISIQAPEGAQVVEVTGHSVGYESQSKTIVLKETGLNSVELRLPALNTAQFRVLDVVTLGRIDQAKITYHFKLRSGHPSQRVIRTTKGQGITDVPLKDKTLTLSYEEASKDIIKVYLKPR